jgi:hypothetical protein
MLDRLARSELSVAAFARSVGVSVQRIHYWRERLAAPPQPAPNPPTPFVPLLVRSQPALKITLDSLVLELPHDTHAERIAEIVCAITQRQRAC